MTRGPVQFATSKSRLLATPASARADLDPPDDLDDVAKLFWSHHAEALADADLLSPQDVFSFRELCDVYSLLQIAKAAMRSDPAPAKVRAFNDLLSKYSALAKQFMLFPGERRRNAVRFGGNNGERHPDKPEFEF